MIANPHLRTRYFVMHGKEHIECRHWYWLRRLVGRRGFCRKCEAQVETIVRALRDKIDADCMAAMLPKPEPTTYPPKPPTHHWSLKIEGS